LQHNLSDRDEVRYLCFDIEIRPLRPLRTPVQCPDRATYMKHKICTAKCHENFQASLSRPVADIVGQKYIHPKCRASETSSRVDGLQKRRKSFACHSP